MKLCVVLFFLCFAASASSLSATHVVTNVGSDFSPSALTMNLGDTVMFVLATIHNAVEVSKATWDADGSTSNGGFITPFGGGMVVPDHPGTYYYACANHSLLGMKGTIEVASPTGIGDERRAFPLDFSLAQNYPNPFNPRTSIGYELPVGSQVTVTVVDLLGTPVATLVNQVQEAGHQSIAWDATGVASGIYFYRIAAASISEPARTFMQVRRMVLLR